jgi:hypothetical protein
MRRTTIPSAALVVVGALLLTGCSGTGGSGPTSIGDVCGTLKTALTEVSNDVEAALADAAEPSEVQANLEGYADAVDALAESAQNADVADALATLGEGLADAAAEVATLPTDAEGDLDPDVLSEQKAGIAEAVEKANAACTESSGG